MNKMSENNESSDTCKDRSMDEVIDTGEEIDISEEKHRGAVSAM